MKAVKWARLEAAGVLISLGADVNARDRWGSTALMDGVYFPKWKWACSSIEMARLLIASGADVNAKNNNGWTALMSASLNGQLQVAKALVRAGANVGAKNEEGKTAEWFARSKGFDDLAGFLRTARSESDPRSLRRTGRKKERHR